MIWQDFCQLVLIFCTVFLVPKSTANELQLITLNESNWRLMLEKEWMVEFYAPWCPACNSLESAWKAFSLWGLKHSVNIAQIDVTLSPGLSGRFMVTALPTIYHVIDSEFRQYKGARNLDDFIKFITEKKWKEVEQIPNWKSPNSFQMSVVAWFFKISQTLRYIHTKLMEDFGLPTWGSYGIFALATIIIGGLLGLILVFVIDTIFPSKDLNTSHFRNKATPSHYDELPDEDIKDDLLDDASTSNDSDRKDNSKIRKRKLRRAE